MATLPPLDWRVPVVHKDGTPTDAFTRAWNSQRTINGAGVTLFTELTDVPASYAGKGKYLVRVNTAVTGLEFVTLSQELDDGLGLSQGNIAMRGASTWGVLADANDATKFLNGAHPPVYAAVKDSDLSTSDITTNNVSTSKHGFAPKGPNDATKYLDGTLNWSTPAGGGGGGGEVTVPAFVNSSSAFSTAFFGGRLFCADQSITVNSLKCAVAAAVGTAVVTPAVYAVNAAMAPTTLLTSGATVTGVTQGVNKFPITALAITRGTFYVAGFIVQTAGFSPITAPDRSVFFAQAGNVPPNTAPAATTGASSWASMWLSPDT